MAETSDGQPAAARASEDGDPDSPARSFFSRLFRRDDTDTPASPAATGAREMLVNLRNMRRMQVEDVSVPASPSWTPDMSR